MNQLPDYAKMQDGSGGSTVGATNQTLRGTPITRVNSYIGGYRDVRVEEKDGIQGWTTAVEILVSTNNRRQTSLIVRDPDLLTTMAAQLLDASIRLRQALEREWERKAIS